MRLDLPLQCVDIFFRTKRKHSVLILLNARSSEADVRFFVLLSVLLASCSASHSVVDVHAVDAAVSPPDARAIAVDARMRDAHVVDAWRADAVGADAFECVFRPARARDTLLTPEVAECLGVANAYCSGCHRDGDDIYLFGVPGAGAPPPGLDLDGTCVWCD